MWIWILILVILWALGVFVVNMGALVHGLLIVALVLFIVRLAQGGKILG